MKTFETPFVNVVKFNIMDVLTTSGAGCGDDCYAFCADDNCENDTGF